MRYYISLLVCCLGFSPAWSQVSTTFILPDVTGREDSEICLPITADDFTGGIEFSFGLGVEPGGGLTFSRIQRVNSSAIPNFSRANFNLTDYLPEGIITVEWQNYRDDQDCSDAPSVVTLDDGVVIFEVCYDIDAPLTSFHPVRFLDKADSPAITGDDSVPIVFNKRPQCNQQFDAFPGIKQGSVTVGVEPLILRLEEQPGVVQPGGLYCTRIVVESGFVDLTSTQYGLVFDPDVLRVNRITPNGDLSGNRDGTYNDFDGISFYSSWTPNFTDGPQTKEDGFVLVTVCFDVVGECGQGTPIRIGELPQSLSGRPAEASREEPLIDYPIIGRETYLAINECNSPGFDVVVDCPNQDVEFGRQDVCVQIQAGTDFINMNHMNYAVTWDATILEFTSVRSMNSSVAIDPNSDFNTDRTQDGILFFDWSFPINRGVSLNEGEVVYELCFDVIGFGGISPITIANYLNDNVSATEGPFNGLDPTNCSIAIERPPGVAIYFPETTNFRSSENECFDITTAGFTDVTGFSLNVIVPPSLAEYREFIPALPGVTLTETPDGTVQLNYAGTPTTIPDGASIATLCYRATTTIEAGTCAGYGLVPDVTSPSQIFTAESPVNSVPIEEFPGEACILSPNGFGIQVQDAQTAIGESFCVPVRVSEFVAIRSAEARFLFDPTLATFDHVDIDPVQWPGLAPGNFNTSGAGTGAIELSFTNTTTGVTTPGGSASTEVFQLCFTARNRPGCFALRAEPNGEPPTMNNEGPGSLVITNGEVCIEDRLIVTSIEAVDASCNEVRDGGIRFTTAPRDDGAPVFIRTDNPIRVGRDGFVTGLRAGVQNYVIYTEGGGVREEGSITIEVKEENAAVANAGPDRQFTCDPGAPQRVILQSRGNVGETYALSFLDPNGRTRPTGIFGDVPNGGAIPIIVDESARYLLELTSASGCTAQDTVVVSSGERPVADGGGDQIIGCDGRQVIVDGSGSSSGFNVRYLWERINPMDEVLEIASEDAVFSTRVPGRYRLTVTFVDLLCSSTDVITVTNSAEGPDSSLEPSAELTCGGGELLLSAGDFDATYRYTWYELGAGPEPPLSTGNTVSVATPGSYVVAIEDTASQCSSLDTVVVRPVGGGTTVTLPAPPSLRCDTAATLIQPLYTGVDEATRYTWFTEEGSFSTAHVNGPTARVTGVGTYRVVVDNGECTDTFPIVVGTSLPPDVEAGEDAALSCDGPTLLTGGATTPINSTLTYTWAYGDPESEAIGGTTEMMVEAPGVYYFTATVTETGCSRTDSVIVTATDGFPEYILPDTVGGLGCAPSSVVLAFDELTAEDYTFVWLDAVGTQIGTGSTANATASGLYSVVVTNPATGCTSTGTVFVQSDPAQVPDIQLEQNGTVLTCDRPEITIDARQTTANGAITFAWEALGVGQDLTDATGDTVTITAPGTYRLTVTNPATNCSSTRDFAITEDREEPALSIESAGDLDCTTRKTSVTIITEADPSNYEIAWWHPAVMNLPGDVTSITVTEGGPYSVTIIDRNTFCRARRMVTIEENSTGLPIIRVADTDTFGCDAETVRIDASATDFLSANPEDIRWEALDGGTVFPASGSPLVAVDAPGRFAISLPTPSGCVARDTVSVASGGNRPTAEAGPAVFIGCGEMPQLDGGASTPAPGDGVVYNWSVVSGPGEILSGEDGATPFVSGVGTYRLTVTNEAAGCNDVATVTVSALETDRAVLPDDIVDCGDGVIAVPGNLPANTTGEWSTVSGEPDQVAYENNVATITRLGDGVTLAWTLSQSECPDYSSDTIAILPSTAPTASNDLLTVTEADPAASVDLAANDDVSGPYVVTLLDNPGFGTITSESNGVVGYEMPAGSEGSTTMDYEICQTECATRCDMATLTIVATVEPVDTTPTDTTNTPIDTSQSVDAKIYNAITPNGDGLNDVLIFDLLHQRPVEFARSDFVVFSRWGDVVYETSAYRNDWGGTTDGGAELPEGTYYYILRLDIGEGKIIRGDVTIVR